jgi:hypothetical protein
MAKIKEEKRLNFPNNILGLPALTAQDVEAVHVLSKLLTAKARYHVKKRQVFSEFTKQHGLF